MQENEVKYILSTSECDESVNGGDKNESSQRVARHHSVQVY